jgi:hypothetical protein
MEFIILSLPFFLPWKASVVMYWKPPMTIITTAVTAESPMASLKI